MLLAAADLFISIADILSLAVLLYIIQFYVQPETAGSAFFPDSLFDRNSSLPIIIFFILFSIKNAVAFLVTRAHYNFSADVALRFSRNNLASYQNENYSAFVNADASTQIRQIAFHPYEFAQFVLSGIQQVITQSSLVLIAVIAILIFNAKLFLLLLLILLPPALFVFYYIRKKLGRIKNEVTYANEQSFRHLLDALKGWVESNIYGRNEMFLTRFLHYRKRFGAALFNSISWQSLPARFIEVFAVLGLFGLIIVARWYDEKNGDAFLTIGAFMAAAYKIIPGMVRIINTSGQIKAFESSITALRKFDEGIKITGTGENIQSISFKNVSFSYNGMPVLHHLDLELKKGDFAGIRGLSGSGKTTVMNIMLGFLQPVSGTVFINGKEAQYGLKKYWTRVAYVRQQSFFMHDTILNNVTLCQDEYDQQRMEEAVTVSGIGTMFPDSRDGLQKMITENGKNISGGQQQRIALARALYKDADIILLDEPFNELDEKSEQEILRHMAVMAKRGKIILMITHDTRSLAYCNKIISVES